MKLFMASRKKQASMSKLSVRCAPVKRSDGNMYICILSTEVTAGVCNERSTYEHPTKFFKLKKKKRKKKNSYPRK